LIPLLMVASFLGVTSLQGEVTLNLDSTTGALTGELTSELVPQATLVSYLQALDSSYVNNDVDRLWDYPNGPQETHFRWLSVEVDGNKISIQSPASISLQGHYLRVRFNAVIPERYGALGRIENDFWLLAVVPFLITNGDDPKRSRTLSVDWKVNLSHTGEGFYLERLTHFRGDPNNFFVGFSRRGYEASPTEQSPLTMVAARKVPRSFAPGVDWGHINDLGSWLDERAARERRKTYDLVMQALKPLGIKPQRWLEAPMRREVAACGGDVLLVSRELFRLFPLEAFLRFHRIGLMRYAFACAFKRAWNVDDEDADALAVYWLTHYQTAKKKASDLLRPLAFIPDIDSLIYAPQMTWPHLYFDAIDEAKTGPKTASDFFHQRPAGKLFYEKLRDRLGDQKVSEIFDHAIAAKQGPIAQALIEAHDDAQIIIDDFFGNYPEYDARYHVDGTQVQIEKIGPGRNTREPIDVEAIDKNGRHQTLRFVGDAANGKLNFNLLMPPLAHIRLDPQHRLVERYFGAEQNDPRFNNSDQHRLRFTLTRLFAAFGFSGSELTAGADFSLRREYDLHHYFGFGAYYQPTGLGVSGRYGYAFGPRVTADTLAYYVGAGLSLERLTQGFAGATSPVYQASGAFNLVYDDRPSDRTSLNGFAWLLHADMGVPYGRPIYGSLGAGVLKIFKLTYDQAFALRFRLDTTLGKPPTQALLSLGGHAHARGFPEGELVGDHRALLSVEHRHELWRGYRTNIGDLFYVEGIEGALFADAVLLSKDGQRFFDYQNFYYDVGYGIRFLFDQLGVNPGMFAIDFGVPIKRFDPHRPPVSVFFDFVESFSDF